MSSRHIYIWRLLYSSICNPLLLPTPISLSLQSTSTVSATYDLRYNGATIVLHRLWGVLPFRRVSRFQYAIPCFLFFTPRFYRHLDPHQCFYSQVYGIGGPDLPRGIAGIHRCQGRPHYWRGYFIGVELGHIRSSVPLRQLHIYTLAPRVPLISDPLPESAHGQPR